MLQLQRTASMIVLTFLLGLCSVYAQETYKPDKEKLIGLHFSGYTVEDNRLLTNKLQESGYRIVFACVPAGIILVEADQILTAAVRMKLVTRLGEVKAGLQYKMMEGYTEELAEQECSSVRERKVK